MKRTFLVPALLALLTLTACQNSIKDEPFTAATLQDPRFKEELTEKEQELVGQYVMGMAMAKAFTGELTADSKPDEVLDGKLTIRHIIEQQIEEARRDSVAAAEEKRKAEEALARREAELARLRGMITVTPVRKTFEEYRYQEYNVITVTIANRSEKAVRGFKGRLAVDDMFGDNVANLEIKQDKAIPAGESVVRELAYDYNQFSDTDSNLRYTELEKLKFTWEPEIIIFEDGSELRLTEIE